MHYSINVMAVNQVRFFHKVRFGFFRLKLHIFGLGGTVVGVCYGLVALQTASPEAFIDEAGNPITSVELIPLLVFVVAYFLIFALCLGLTKSKAKFTAFSWLSGSLAMPLVLFSNDPLIRNLVSSVVLAFITSICLLPIGIVIDKGGRRFNTYVSGKRTARMKSEKKSSFFYFFVTRGPNKESFVWKSLWISLIVPLFFSQEDTYAGELDYPGKLFLVFFGLTLAYYRTPFVTKQQIIRNRLMLRKECETEYKALREEIEDTLRRYGVVLNSGSNSEFLNTSLSIDEDFFNELDDETELIDENLSNYEDLFDEVDEEIESADLNSSDGFSQRIDSLGKKWRERAIDQRVKTKTKYIDLVSKTESQINDLIASESKIIHKLLKLYEIEDIERLKKAQDRARKIRLGLTKARIPKDADDFEEVCAEWMRKTGYPDAKRTPKGPDGGVDVVSSEAVAQAKMYSNKKVTGEEVRALIGSRVALKKEKAIFFTYGPGYTDDAIRTSIRTKTILYWLDVDKREFRRIR